MGLAHRPALAKYNNGLTLLQSGVRARRKLHYALHDLQSMLLLFFLKKASKSAFLNSVQGNPSCTSVGACGGLFFRASGGPDFLVHLINPNYGGQELSLRYVLMTPWRF